MNLNFIVQKQINVLRVAEMKIGIKMTIQNKFAFKNVNKTISTQLIYLINNAIKKKNVNNIITLLKRIKILSVIIILISLHANNQKILKIIA